MSEDIFEYFIKFGHILDKNARQMLISYWKSYIEKKKRPLHSENAGLQPYTKFIDDLLSNFDLIDIMRGNPTIYSEISSKIINAFSEVQDSICSHSPFLEEELSFFKWNNQSTDSVIENCDEILVEIRKNYDNNKFNFVFFSSQIEQLKSIKKTKEKEENQNLVQIVEKEEALKQELIDRWSALLQYKKDLYFLEELDKKRQSISEELYKHIEQYKKILKILHPFTNECGRLWDLSRGSWRNVGFNILEKYSELLQKEPELQILAEMLGKMHQAEDELEEEEIKETIIKPCKKIIHAGKSELVGCHESNDINNLLPIELTLLNDATTELVFYKKFAEKKLLTYQFIGIELGKKEFQKSNKRLVPKKNKRGPIIICVDTSGSMHGTPEYVAKILCFAITRIALQEQRKCYLISFSTGIETIELSNLKENLVKLIEFLSMSFLGGTDAIPAFNEALNQLKTKSYEKADVLMISDFIMSALDTTTKDGILKAKEKDTKFHSLIISTAGNPQALDIFDNNWVYNQNNPDGFKSVLKNVRNINSLKKKD